MTILLYILFTFLGASIAVFAMSVARMSSNIDKIYEESLELKFDKEYKYSKVEVEELCRKAFEAGDNFRFYINQCATDYNVLDLPSIESTLDYLCVDTWIETNLY